MSTKYPTLKNAPITEAIVDIRCKLPQDFDVNQFKSIGNKISSDYPIEKVFKIQRAEIPIGGDFEEGEQNVKTRGELRGYIYESSDGTKVVQLKLDGFTFNRLKPYKDWEEIRD